MSDLKYTYALDSTKTFLVLINNARKDKEYFCPNSKCDERLIIKDGRYGVIEKEGNIFFVSQKKSKFS